MPDLPNEDPLKPSHERAQRRWPTIRWGWDAFAAHTGDERPPHLEDLYLGGAAGHRVDGAWAAISTELSEPLASRLRRQACGTSTPEDLVSESIATMMADDPTSSIQVAGRPPSKLIRYRGRTTLVNYFLVVAKRLAISSHRKGRLEQGEPIGFDPPAAEPPPDGGESREQAEQLFAGVRRAYASLSARQRFLLAMIYGRGLGKSEAGRLVGLPPWGVTRELDRVHDAMRAALAALLPDSWAPLPQEAWAAAWKSCWNEHEPLPTPSEPDADRGDQP